MVRCLPYLQLDGDDNVWAPPVDGIVAYVDLITSNVVGIVDLGNYPVPTKAENFHLDDRDRLDGSFLPLWVSG